MSENVKLTEHIKNVLQLTYYSRDMKKLLIDKCGHLTKQCEISCSLLNVS